jgi:outer membrane lipoprotein-sorting protein
LRFLLFLLALLSAPPSACPAATTVLKGSITDYSNGKPVTAAIVSLESFAVIRKRIRVSTASSAAGEYRIEALLPSGIYKIECSGQGYRKYSALVNIASGRLQRRDIRLLPLRKPPNRAPVIKGVIPEEGREILCGAETRVSVCAFDPEGGPLEYRFLSGQSVLRDWKRNPVCIWEAPAEPADEVFILCQARDRAGLIAEKNVRYRLFKPSPAAILEKVKANYSGVSDFSAQMRFESHSGLPDGHTVKYCRYYFLAPDKERTDSYAKPAAAGIPEQTLIVDKDKLIYIAGSQRREVDLKREFSDSGLDINILNVCYAADDFFSGHEIKLDRSAGDAGNLIFALEAVPLKENSLYKKLLLRVDYRRGVISGFDIYTAGEDGEGIRLRQSIRVLKTKEFPGKIFLPMQMKKTVYLGGGEIRSEISYSQARLNSGLSGEKFK